MKKEDMKKLYLEERNVSNRVKYLLLIFFLVISYNAYFAQSINGFCGYKEFITSEGNKKLLIDDNLLAYGSTEKSITLHKNFTSSDKADVTDLFFPYLISSLQSFGNNDDKSSYIFTSRKERRAGWFVIKDSANLKIIDEIEFESYPGQIVVEDFDLDGNKDGIISGNSFDGLSLIQKNKEELRTEKIVRNRVFSAAASIDLDYDNYPDLAAFDLFSNKLVFFYNDQTGNFYEGRSLDFRDEIKNVLSLDFNSDGFNDILLHTNKNLTLLSGDSVSSFVNRKIIKTEGNISALAAVDINNDEFSDFVLIDHNDDIVKLMLSREDEDYIETVALMSGGIIDLCIAKPIDENKNFSGIFILSDEGRIINLHKVEEVKDFFRISMGARPNTLALFGKDKNIAFEDDFTNSLNIVSVRTKNFFDELYSYRLSQTFSNSLYSEISNEITAAYLFTTGSKLIEILKLDSRMKKLSETNIYANKPISEVIIRSGNDKDSIF